MHNVTCNKVLLVLRSLNGSSTQVCYLSNINNFPRRVFSGIQPTGVVHLGNYFGALTKWVEFQQSEENVTYSIVDLHSITLPHDPSALRFNILHLTATLLACGIDPTKSIIFQQSSVPKHTALSWVLGCLSTMPRLTNLPQFKEKSANLKDIPLGLYIYPVLQSADILLYRSTHVPVGEDQLSHLYLAQHLAKKFNSTFGSTFPVPEAIVGDEYSRRIKSLRNPEKKMSKSEQDPKGRIELTDSKDAILEKCKKAITDFTSKLTFDPENRPGVSNLITIHSLLTGLQPDAICQEYVNLDTGKYKLVLAEIIEEKISPVRERIHNFLAKPDYLKNVLEDGNKKASVEAEKTWQIVAEKVGFL